MASKKLEVGSWKEEVGSVEMALDDGIPKGPTGVYMIHPSPSKKQTAVL
jgi:hypothetical protein